MSDEQKPEAMNEATRELADALAKFAEATAESHNKEEVPPLVRFALDCENSMRDFVQDGEAWKLASDGLQSAVTEARMHALAVISRYLGGQG